MMNVLMGADDNVVSFRNVKCLACCCFLDCYILIKQTDPTSLLFQPAGLELFALLLFLENYILAKQNDNTKM